MNVPVFVLASRPKGLPSKENFRIESRALAVLKDGHVWIKALYYSVDPYMRGRMNDVKSYASPFEIDSPLYGAVIGEVKETKSPAFKKGDLVKGILPWATEAVVPSGSIEIIDTGIAPSTYYLGILGMPGLTAYFGLLFIGRPRFGETVVISGAAGAVGIVAGQIAKLKGCRIVGIAGSDEKIKMLQEEFDFEEVINYKTTPDMNKAIKEKCREVDIYFDNVGGEISDAVISNINFFGRIVLCGQISLYNEPEIPPGPRLQPILLSRSALMQGFIVGNYKSSFSEGIQQLSQWLKEGKLKYKETVIDGFEKLPEALLGLFSGNNKGKMIVKA